MRRKAKAGKEDREEGPESDRWERKDGKKTIQEETSVNSVNTKAWMKFPENDEIFVFVHS